MSSPEPPAEGVTRRSAIAAAVMFLLVTAGIGVARRPIAASDEAREAAVVKNMLVTGDWRRSELGGEILYEKPPFFYMAVAAAARATGSLSPLSARFPSVLFAALALGATFSAGAALFSPRCGVVAMLLLATSYLFIVNAHNCLIDVPVLGFTALGLAAFIARERRGEPRWDLWWGLAVAGALLAKGLIGPILLVLFTVPFWWLSGKRRPITHSVSPGALLLPLLAFGLWVALTWSSYGPHGLYEVLWINHVGRFLGFAEPRYVHHRASFFFYLPLLPGLVFPWVLLFAGGLRRAFAPDGRRALRPLAWGFLAAFLLLSASGTKRTVYLLPLLPVVALLSAGYLEEVWRRPTAGALRLLQAQLPLVALGVAVVALLPALLEERVGPTETGVLAGAVLAGALIAVAAGESANRLGRAALLLAAVGLGLLLFHSLPRMEADPDAEFFRIVERRVSPEVPFYAYNVNLDILGKALLEMPRPPREEYSVERSIEVCQKGPAFVLSEVEHLEPPHVAPLREALAPVYVGRVGDKLVALYRCRVPSAR